MPEAERCSEKIWHDQGPGGARYPCELPATTHEEGKPYCTIHAPSYVEAKRQRRAKAYEARSAEQAATRALLERREKMADMFPAAMSLIGELAGALWDFGASQTERRGSMFRRAAEALDRADAFKSQAKEE